MAERYINLFGISKDEVNSYIESSEIKVSVENSFMETLLILESDNEELLDKEFKKGLERFKMNLFSTKRESLPETVHNLLLDSGYTLSGAESCTGGLISKILTDYDGASSYFKYSVVTYSNISKEKLLHVPSDTLKDNGAVSKATVVSMLDGLDYMMPTTFAYAVSGVAGPRGGSPDKPVGTVFIGIMSYGQREVEKYHFEGSRDEIRNKAAWIVFKKLLDKVCKNI